MTRASLRTALRPVTRAAVSCAEGLVFVVCYVSSWVAIGLLLDYLYDHSTPIITLAFPGAVLVAFAAVRPLRRRTRSWKIAYDAEGYLLSKAERQCHPTLVRYKRLATSVLVCLPSVIAAFVLFFLPVATHLAHPSSHYLPHWIIPIPWNLQIHRWPEYNYVVALSSGNPHTRDFGLTSTSLSSAMHFHSVPATEWAEQQRDRERHPRDSPPNERWFSPGGVRISCLQDRYYEAWRIDCETPGDAGELNLSALFLGSEEDIATFYQIIKGLKVVK